jgi:hypothetical protein
MFLVPYSLWELSALWICRFWWHTHGKDAENSVHKQLSFRFVVVYDTLKIT